MQINGREIANGTDPYIVAEISGNHGGDLKGAMRLIDAAKKAGADAVKTQCYTADSITIDCDKDDFIAKDGPWEGRKLYDLYKEAATPPEWHADLYKKADDAGITIFSSVFDEAGLELLEKLGCPAYKIASFEATDPYLIDKVASTKKPLIISCGAISDHEVNNRAMYLNDVCFLHCVSQYPTPVEDAALDRIRTLKTSRHPVGLSDHSDGIMIPIMSVVMGVAMIEKHIRLPKGDPVDGEFSLKPDDFFTMVEGVKLARQALSYTPKKPETQYRRSLYAIKDIKPGDIFTHQNVRSIRPGYGSPVSMWANLMGEEATKHYERGDRI